MMVLATSTSSAQKSYSPSSDTSWFPASSWNRISCIPEKYVTSVLARSSPPTPQVPSGVVDILK